MKYAWILTAILIAGCASTGQQTMTRDDVEELKAAVQDMADAMDRLLEVQAGE